MEISEKIVPSSIVNKLLDHCTKLTKNGREWLESNPGKRMPFDYVKYPGKMDHTTCLAFQVGQKYALAPHQANLSSWTSANTCKLFLHGHYL